MKIWGFVLECELIHSSFYVPLSFFLRRYQSVTNWFQNQRGIIKKRQSDAGVDLCQAESKRLCANTFTPSALYSFPGPSEYGSHPSCSDGMNRTMARTKRVRPEPCQLEALRKLFMKTSNPSIEERVALSRDIGMFVQPLIKSKICS